MSEVKRLHPVSAVINFVKSLKDSLLPLLAIIFLNGNFSGGSVNWISIGITGLVLLSVLLRGIFRWISFTYRVEEGELRIEYGLIFKKKRYIPIDRIQSLNFSEGIFHRPFHLVKVSVETAGGSGGKQKAEAELTAIKRTEADELENLIYKEQQTDVSLEQEVNKRTNRKLVYEMKWKDIVVMAISSGGVGVVLSGAGVFFSQFMDVLPLGTLYNEIKDWLQFSVLIIAFSAFVLLLIAYGISIILTVFRYANFAVYLEENDVIITRGLLEKKQMTIPRKRIQGIRMDENLIRQPLGYASLTLISAGGSMNKEAEQQLRLFPLIKRNQIRGKLAGILDDYGLDVSIKRPPVRSVRRYLLRKSWITWILSAAAIIIFFPLGLFSLIVPLFFTGIGWLSYRDAGWNVNNDQLLLRNRAIGLQTYIMKRHRIQSAAVSQTIFQKRAELESVAVSLKSGDGRAKAECLYLEKNDCETIMKWYRPFSKA
ncbi:PH domain-containing protein [Halobacillus rhizosphaerae]|uniref:PH domain-containing protein n=1 Tax=Halobacillus rhizosphaerae TaxID=3064889 RepID=UPI00398AE0B9